MQKRTVFVLFLLIILVCPCFSGCSDSKSGGPPPGRPNGFPNNIWYDAENKYPWTDVFDENYQIDYEYATGIPMSGQMKRIYERLDFEQNYDQIEFILDGDCYPVNFDSFTCTVRNKTGKAFYIWPWVELEKNVDGVWVDVSNAEFPAYRDASSWILVGYDDYLETDENGNRTWNFDKEFPESFQPTDSILLQVDWWKTVTPGEHRLVVIVGKEVFYLPFEIYDPKAETSPTVSQYLKPPRRNAFVGAA